MPPMNDLTVLVPTRERPEHALALANQFALTCGAPGTRLIFIVDDSDPSLDAYLSLSSDRTAVRVYAADDRSGMVAPLNTAAVSLTGDPQASPYAVAFMGDDHRPRTPSWDRQLLDALAEPDCGIVYGNDLVHGAGLPTSVAMRSSIVRAVGYMAPPCLRHLYVDNAWLEWGRRAACLKYLPDVIIEHMHPLVNKAPSDRGYEWVNSQASRDHQAWMAYLEDERCLIDAEQVAEAMVGDAFDQ